MVPEERNLGFKVNKEERRSEARATIDPIGQTEETTLARTFGRVQVQDGPAAQGKRIEEASDFFMHAPLGLGDIAQLVELCSWNCVVAIRGWMKFHNTK